MARREETENYKCKECKENKWEKLKKNLKITKNKNSKQYFNISNKNDLKVY